MYAASLLLVAFAAFAGLFEGRASDRGPEAPPAAVPEILLPPAAPAAEPLAIGAEYPEVLAWLAQRREVLATQLDHAPREAVLAEAWRAQLAVLRERVFPAWSGTAWDMNGTSEVPGKGTIACGYFVSTVLRDLGYPLDRVALGQAPAELIVRSFSPESRIWRFYRSAPAEVVALVAEQGEGLYLVGLDTHVGFLLVDAEGEVELCHATRRRPERRVLCEPAATSPSLRSGYHVVGQVLGPERVEGWLLGQPVVTAVKVAEG